MLDKYLMLKPTTRMVIEWPVLIAVGIIGAFFTRYRIPYYPISNIIGGAVLVLGMVIHMRCHLVHQQADQQSEKIEKLLTTRIFPRASSDVCEFGSHRSRCCLRLGNNNSPYASYGYRSIESVNCVERRRIPLREIR